MLTPNLEALLAEVGENTESVEQMRLARLAFEHIAGLTQDEAIAFVDSARWDQSWSTVTYLCVMDGLDEARQRAN